MSGLIFILSNLQSHVFLVNSRLSHFSAPSSLRVPFSRSYGVNLPSSLAMIHSSTLGFSPHPPVSVYGTGWLYIIAWKFFLEVCLPHLSDCPKTLGTVGSQHHLALNLLIYLHPLTCYSVSRRACHFSVSPSLYNQVMEY